jgi:tetratricopeptide (TPR) repeat protein
LLRTRRLPSAKLGATPRCCCSPSSATPPASPTRPATWGSLDWRLADLGAAERRYERARDLYVDIQAWWHVATVEQYLGNVAYHRGDLHRARWHYTRARLGLRALRRDPRDIADIDVNLAGLLTELGDHPRALDLLDEATALYESVLAGDDLAAKLAEVDQNRRRHPHESG